MNSLIHMLDARPGYGFSSQYGPTTLELNSIIGYSNYFGQVFRDQKIPVDLHLVLFDRNGVETACQTIPVEADGGIQVNCRDLVVDSDGMIAVSAVPRVDIATINGGKLKLKECITTGFYIEWYGNGGGRDIMHEWAGVRRTPSPTQTFVIGVAHSRQPLRHGLILMNPVVGCEQSTAVQPQVSVSTPDRRQLGKATLADIPSMGSTEVDLSGLFAGFDAWLVEHGKLIVQVVSANLAPPLTLERHASRDFHIHHL